MFQRREILVESALLRLELIIAVGLEIPAEIGVPDLDLSPREHPAHDGAAPSADRVPEGVVHAAVADGAVGDLCHDLAPGGRTGPARARLGPEDGNRTHMKGRQ